MRALELEQGRLRSRTAAVGAERSTATQDAVTGNDDRERIRRERGAGRAHRSRAPRAGGDVPVGGGLPVGDLGGGAQHLPPESVCEPPVERDLEARAAYPRSTRRARGASAGAIARGARSTRREIDPRAAAARRPRPRSATRPGRGPARSLPRGPVRAACRATRQRRRRGLPRPRGQRARRACAATRPPADREVRRAQPRRLDQVSMSCKTGRMQVHGCEIS